ncbi:MAG: indole-3-glycerol phosphate synthase TrpC [Phototrophicaceae bacterium]|jgi:indole-3-glycerol phosphate synthase
MSAFIKTDTILDKILARKVEEVEAALLRVPLADVRAAAESAPAALDVLTALVRSTVALIAEVKQASPSKGILIEPFHPVELATTYAENGAAMISVLTDQDFFKGHLDYLRAIRSAVNIPLLRKEFIIDVYQVYEARAAGADAVLLITAALEDAPLADLHALIVELGMTPLVEVHDEAELERALRLTPRLVGVNNRDLRTFHTDIETTGRVAKQVPANVILVAESGMKTHADVQRMGELGAHAVLIGEGLVTAPDIAVAVRDMSSQGRPQ